METTPQQQKDAAEVARKDSAPKEEKSNPQPAQPIAGSPQKLQTPTAPPK